MAGSLDGLQVIYGVTHKGELDHHFDTDLGHPVHELYLAVELTSP
jgi:hypothetical protein